MKGLESLTEEIKFAKESLSTIKNIPEVLNLAGNNISNQLQTIQEKIDKVAKFIEDQDEINKTQFKLNNEQKEFNEQIEKKVFTMNETFEL